MKQFKLNAFEKFVIRHKKTLMISLYIVFFVSNIIFSHFRPSAIMPTNTFIMFVLMLPLFIYVDLLPIFKNIRIFRAHQNLRLDYALDGISKLTDALNPNNTTDAPTVRTSKASYLIDAGRLTEAEEEIKLIFQKLNIKKGSPADLLNLHTVYALIKIKKGDEESFSEQLKIVEGYYNKNKKHLNKCITQDAFESLSFAAAAHFEPYSEDFEQKVLNSTEFSDGKRRKKIAPYEYFSAYSLLFNYFVRFENTEKAVYYAHKITETRKQ